MGPQLAVSEGSDSPGAGSPLRAGTPFYSSAGPLSARVWSGCAPLCPSVIAGHTAAVMGEAGEVGGLRGVGGYVTDSSPPPPAALV